MTKEVAEKSPFIFSIVGHLEKIIFPSFNEIRYFAVFAALITLLAFRPELTASVVEAVKEEPRIGFFILLFLIFPIQMVLKKKLDHKTKHIVCMFYYIFLATTAMIAASNFDPNAQLTMIQELSKIVANIIMIIACVRAFVTIMILKSEWEAGERYIAKRLSDEQYKPLVFLGVLCAAPIIMLLASRTYTDPMQQLLYTHLGLLMGLKMLDMALGPRATHRPKSKKR